MSNDLTNTYRVLSKYTHPSMRTLHYTLIQMPGVRAAATFNKKFDETALIDYLTVSCYVLLSILKGLYKSLRVEIDDNLEVKSEVKKLEGRSQELLKIFQKEQNEIAV